jgi:YebC/PmpR family DNA-binding regulatory protein
MSGHSKWSTIKRKKEGIDAARGKVFTKIGKEITVAVREGGPDPANNSKLQALILKAKANNVPNDNIERSIKKAAGLGDKTTFEEITYEGYGPCGVAVIVETLTDNRNRTAGDVRSYFSKYGGNLGQTGSVSFMFDCKGLIVIADEDLDEDKLMEDVMEAGGEDFKYEDGVAEIYTAPNDFPGVRDALYEMGYRFESADVAYIPQTTTVIDDPDTIVKMQKLLAALEDNDDVNNVWHSWEMPEEDDED